MEHIWTMLMHKILQNHFLCAFVADMKIGAIYALYLESFCDKNLAIRKVFAFVTLVPLALLINPCKFQENVNLGETNSHHRNRRTFGPK